MRTAAFIFFGFLIYTVVFWVDRKKGTAAKRTLIFAGVWLVISAVNLWSGLYKGYTLKEELPIFLLIFFVPLVVGWIFFNQWKDKKGKKGKK